ncbi:hypothetical protein JMF89_07180 [Clostridiaceae bacterium UIB06]|uniref:HlyD family secretion protein n=1 Tax=Clostridium thailandense TaxID=2794346 RepID=A0A949THQ7_9CLOT|nr:hypothetical protein [Clostridium thailandense]MBV7272460.1 hypothetical protein [Clostridium thailandense]MCH5136984.1 hypothetical protein [Clostridiaceae bacterium UIB06]
MENNLFRKSSIERISSPEQLNDYLKVTNISVWCILGALFALLFGVMIWAFTGSIPETVKISGVAYSAASNADKVYCYVPLGTSKRLEEGMEVQVSPDYASRSEYGYIYGKIESIGKVPVTENQIIQTFGSLKYLQGIIPDGNVIEVKMVLGKNGKSLKWSNIKGEKVLLTSGSRCNVLIITKERKPYELLINKDS